MTTSKVEIVIDTNVAVVANGRGTHAKPSCIRECIDRLSQTINEFCVLLDDDNLILEEYRRHLSPSGQPGTGDAFFKWLHDNQANPVYSRKIKVNDD